MPENWFSYENGMEGLPMNMLPEPLFPDGAEGHLIGVTAMQDGEPFTLTDEITGAVIFYGKPEQVFKGEKDGNRATIILTPEMFTGTGLVHVVVRHGKNSLVVLEGFLDGH